jgi:hypothetical protein
VGAVLAVAVVLGLFAGRWFRADNSARVWLLDDDPALVAYDEFLAQFGNDEVVLIAIGVEDSVYTPETLEVIRRASDRIDAHPDIRRVASITASTHIDGDAIQIVVEPLVPDGPIDAEIAAATRRRVEADPTLRATLVSEDQRVTLIAAQFASLDKVMGRRPQILDDVRAIVRAELEGGDREIHVGGIGVIYDAINRAVLSDTRIFISLSYLLILVGLWVLFRRVAWVLLALGIIVVATVATAGLFGVLDRKLNMVTSIVPTLILTVGVMDLIHLISARQEDAGDLRAGLSAVVVPCVFNTVTDMIGFLVLVTAPMAGIRDFGLIAALGLGFLLTSTLVFAVPALLADARRRPARPVGAGMTPATQAASQRGWTSAIVARAGSLADRHRWWVIGVGIALIGLSAAGARTIVVDTYNLEFLDEDHPTRQSHSYIEDRFGFYIPLEMTVTGGEFKDRETLIRLERAERAIEALPAVDNVVGLPEVITRLNEVVMDGDPAERRIPDSRPAIAQELLLYEGNVDAGLDRLIDPAFSVARVTGRVRMDTARGIKATIDEVETAANAELGDSPRLQVAGYLSLYVEIIDNITSAQVRSFGLAFVLVALVLMLLLRSVRLGLIAMVPNLLPALLTLGVMGVLGVRLDVGTVLVASIAIGISVNDTSHMMFRYAAEIRATPGQARAALDRTLAGTGRAVFSSSIILIAGFGVLGFASTNSIRIFGTLSAATVAFALIADLLLTPALLMAVYDRKASRAGSDMSLSR